MIKRGGRGANFIVCPERKIFWLRLWVLSCDSEIWNVLQKLSSSISDIQSNPYSFRYTVGYERTFSKLRYIKNRLRNQLSQNRLNFLLLICVERDVLLCISNHTIIEELAKMNVEMRRPLPYKYHLIMFVC